MTPVSTTDYGNVGGNTYDKYHTANPIARRLMQGFLSAFDSMVDRVQPATAYEVGCGEGHLSRALVERGVSIRGCDVDAAIVAEANALSGARGHGECFTVRSVYDIGPGEISADLIVCCEVLEHLPDPAAALDILAAQDARHWLFSVPREPLWRGLNMARGKYLGDLGNTPGHIQHWSSKGFHRLIASRFAIVAQRAPLPWTMALCQAR